MALTIPKLHKNFGLSYTKGFCVLFKNHFQRRWFHTGKKSYTSMHNGSNPETRFVDPFCDKKSMLDSVESNDVTDDSKADNAGVEHNSQIQVPSDDASIRISAVSSQEILTFLKEHYIINEDAGYTNYITTCARHRTALDISGVGSLFVNKKTGYFVCQSPNCSCSGNWHQFKDHTLNLVNLIQRREILPESCFSKDGQSTIKRSKKTQFLEIWNSSRTVENTPAAVIDHLKKAIGIEALKTETLATFGVKVLADDSGLVIPLHSGDNFNSESELQCAGIRVVRVKNYINKKEQEKTKITSTVIPYSSTTVMFALNKVNSKDDEVILTGNEFDAMAVNQELGLLSLALPKGSTVLHQALLPCLEQFNKVTVWLGGDQQVWEKAECFTKKLNQARCRLIKPSTDCPNALKALQKHIPLEKILQQSKLTVHKSIVTLQHIRREVYDEIACANKIAGVKWTRYPVLNNLLKGHRRGELTVFTGPTGSGKTTFISDYSLDLATQGVNTLWGSFEINNVRLLKTMLMQYSQCNLVKNIDKFDYWADLFEELPMYFMTFHGHQKFTNVIETMSHAVYVYDIAHVIVDNLQFMMGEENVTKSEDRFMRQDQIIGAFRKFATTMNCHVTLVVHPRKEKDLELTASSIFGSAKASQEADNVLILQDQRFTRRNGRKYIEIVKNRFDGERGYMLLNFNKDTLSYSLVNNTSITENKFDTNDEQLLAGKEESLET